jgi:hypothetical protein
LKDDSLLATACLKGRLVLTPYQENTRREYPQPMRASTIVVDREQCFLAAKRTILSRPD